MNLIQVCRRGCAISSADFGTFEADQSGARKAYFAASTAPVCKRAIIKLINGNKKEIGRERESERVSVNY